jgi:hypothetical protein
MSLPQLIGLQCAACQKGITSIIDGRFCDECGNPVHQRCIAATQPSGEGKCSLCGGNPNSEIAKEVRRNVGGHAQAVATRTGPVNYPISKACPNCKSDKFTRERPQRWVAFAWDRRCTECGTRYSPPTPAWAAVVFIMAGVLLGGFGGFGVIGALATGNPLSVPAMACQGLFGLVGALALFHGIRSLADPGNS